MLSEIGQRRTNTVRCHLHVEWSREFPGGPGIRSQSVLSLPEAWVQSMVRELRSCKLCGTVKKKKKKF